MAVKHYSAVPVFRRLAVMALAFVLFSLPSLAQAGENKRDLILASLKGDVEKVVSLLDAGADVNAKDERGWTALMEAANRGYLEIARLLVDRGADVNLKHLYGWTALSIAKGKGYKKIEALLKARGARR